jgi:hypothetical protein
MNEFSTIKQRQRRIEIPESESEDQHRIIVDSSICQSLAVSDGPDTHFN